MAVTDYAKAAEGYRQAMRAELGVSDREVVEIKLQAAIDEIDTAIRRLAELFPSRDGRAALRRLLVERMHAPTGRYSPTRKATKKR